MPLSETLNKLMVLQSIEEDIEQHKKDKDNLYLDVENQKEVVQEVKDQLEEKRQEKIENQKTADSLEVKIDSLEEENAKFNVQLNSTKNQEEYDKIRNAILSNKADIEKWEDQELTALQKVDNLSDEIDELEESLNEEERKLENIKKEVEEKAEKHEDKLARLQDRKQKTREQIDDEILQNFDRLQASRGGKALVKLKNRICQGCYTQLPKQTENELMRGEEIIYCHNCGHMLILDKQEQTSFK